MKVTKLSERYEISEGEYKIFVTHNLHDEKEYHYWEIETDYGNELFIFKNNNSPETRAKWSAVASMIKRATKLMEGE